MRNLARLLAPCVLVVGVGCGPGPECGADLDYNEETGLCDCMTGGTWGDDGYCRYADGAITLPDGAVPMLDASSDDDAGLPDATLDAGIDAAPDACVTSTFYRDADGDGHGAATDSVTACVAPDGYVESDDDCNDTCETCLPGGTEICTEPALDENCSGESNEAEVCDCTDGTSISCGTTDIGECAFGTQQCTAGAYGACEGAIGSIAEICNGLDDDCDGTIDEGARTTFYRDADSDGFGNASMTMQACSAPAGYVTSSTDCNDACATCRPGGTETCDGLDNNCAGGVDEGVLLNFYRDCDGDTYAPTGAMPTTACGAPARLPSCGAGDSSGWTTRVPSTGSTDCRDNNELVHPGQSGFFTIPIAGTGTYDYNCDGTASRELEAFGWCGTNPILGGCSPHRGWNRAVSEADPACGVTAPYVNNCTSECSEVVVNRTQGCR